MGTCWATLQITVATMWHLEVHCVWPERWIRQWCGDCGIVQERLFFHHCELIVAADTQIWCSHTNHGIVGDVGVFFDDYSHASHFLGPVINGCVRPKTFIIVMSVYVSRMKERKKEESHRKLNDFDLIHFFTYELLGKYTIFLYQWVDINHFFSRMVLGDYHYGFRIQIELIMEMKWRNLKGYSYRGWYSLSVSTALTFPFLKSWWHFQLDVN